MNARPTFRLIDSGVREGRTQIAFDRAMIDLHKAGRVPDTVRFLRFPPTVLVGRHQAIAHNVNLDHVRRHGIGLARRITGGGAIYMDEGQLGWELVFDRRNLALGALGDTAKAICEAVAAGLRGAFGIDSRFRPRNDIEVGGRKLCGTGGFFDGDTLIYQGTVLIDMDPAAMVACLNVPKAKLVRRDLDRAEQRVVTLKELLGVAPPVSAVRDAVVAGLKDNLGIAARDEAIGAAEQAAAEQALAEEIGLDSFVFEIDEPDSGDARSATVTGPGGSVSAHARLEGRNGERIREVLFTGDFFVTPPRLVYDLEAALRGVRTADAASTVASFFETARADLLTIAPADFAAALQSAIAAPAASEGAAVREAT